MRIYITRGGDILLADGSRLPFASEAAALDGCFSRSGSLGEGERWAELDETSEIPENFSLVELRDVAPILGYEEFVRCGLAVQLAAWQRTNKFCGACGTQMRDHQTDRARECPSCGHLMYPTLCPAVIVAVTRGGKLLLARSPKFPPGRMSVLAGFVEPGESLEDTIRREIREEVGIEVRGIKYFGSQPWPFPHSLMIGFTAEWAGGEIAVDGVEIESAGWFSPDELPDMPPSVSISRKLIDDWLTR